MNHSLYSFDRTTHLKIVVISLIGATAVAGFGTAAHARRDDGSVQAAHVSVIKAGKPAMVASRVQLAVR